MYFWNYNLSYFFVALFGKIISHLAWPLASNVNLSNMDGSFCKYLSFSVSLEKKKNF